jgi:serine/threonine-protein kinase
MRGIDDANDDAMAITSSKQFLKLLQHSNLLDDSRFSDFVRSVGNPRESKADDPRFLARELVRRGWITRWHAEKLLSGKYKGFLLGKYKLLDHLGSGGMSHVFLAEQAKIGRRVAVKVLPPAKLAVEGHLDRFLREARAAAQLDHPNIVRAYDVDSHENMYFLVMEYLEGDNLQKKINKSGPLGFDEAANYIAQAARGLHHAHRASLIHRDVKPSNLVLTTGDTIKLMDLGLALLSSESQNSGEADTDADTILGTADYLAPEQARNSHEIDHRADIYGLGCTLYALLCGHPPFAGGTFAQRVYKHQFTQAAASANVRPNCPPLLTAMCERMMAKAPEDRYDSAEQIDQLLTGWLRRTTTRVQAKSESEPANRSLIGPAGSISGDSHQSGSGCSPIATANFTQGTDLSPTMIEQIRIEGPRFASRRPSEMFRVKVKTPLGFWIFLGCLIAILIVLAAVILLRSV